MNVIYQSDFLDETEPSEKGLSYISENAFSNINLVWFSLRYETPIKSRKQKSDL